MAIKLLLGILALVIISSGSYAGWRISRVAGDKGSPVIPKEETIETEEFAEDSGLIPEGSVSFRELEDPPIVEEYYIEKDGLATIRYLNTLLELGLTREEMKRHAETLDTKFFPKYPLVIVNLKSYYLDLASTLGLRLETEQIERLVADTKSRLRIKD